MVATFAAGAWVHGCNQNALRGKTDNSSGTRNGDNPILERLSQGLQNLAVKLRKLIQEKDAAMSQGYFARPRK
jgi:hypothetical protein